MALAGATVAALQTAANNALAAAKEVADAAEGADVAEMQVKVNRKCEDIQGDTGKSPAAKAAARAVAEAVSAAAALTGATVEDGTSSS